MQIVKDPTFQHLLQFLGGSGRCEAVDDLQRGLLVRVQPVDVNTTLRKGSGASTNVQLSKFLRPHISKFVHHFEFAP